MADQIIQFRIPQEQILQRLQEGIGTLLITSSPTRASIFIDDILSGTTPATIENIPVGFHIYRLTLPGFIEASGIFRIDPGATTPVERIFTQARPVTFFENLYGVAIVGTIYAMTSILIGRLLFSDKK